MKLDFIAFKVDIFSVKIYIVVTDVVNDVTFSRKSVNSGHNTLLHDVIHWTLLHDVIHWKRAMPYDKSFYFISRIAYTALDDHESAIECYRKALELDPGNQSYQNNLEISEQKLQEMAARVRT